MISKIFTLAFLALSVSTASASSVSPDDPRCSRSYTIQAGDYCYKISQEQHVSTYQLASVNEGIIADDCSNLEVGERICLGIKGQDCRNTYVVQYGDTCEGIAAANGITVKVLRRLNPQLLDGCPNLYAESSLCVNPKLC